MSQKLKGFTLIELLVVIAIIGVLATVVIGAVNTARTKGADAAIKSNLQALRVEAELFYDTNNSYATSTVTTCPASTNTTSFFGRTASVNALQAAFNATKAGSESFPTGVFCRTTSTDWISYVRLKSDNTKFWCVDSAGNSKEVSSAPSGYTC